MTTNEKQIAIAEACGWTGIFEKKYQGGVYEDTPPFGWFGNPNTGVYPEQPIPPYTTSIDAIREVVLTQSEEFQAVFAREFYLHDFAPKYFHQLTAEDWCDCFLSAMEKIKTNL